MKTALSRRIETMSPPDGLLSREQLKEAGLDKAARRRRVKAGILVPVLPGVFRIASAPESWTQFARATSIWLRGRGVLSHLTTASLQSLTDGEGFPIEVSSTMRSLKSPTSQIVVHRVGALENRDLRWVKGMRITNPLRTVFDLAGSLNPNEFEILLDEARRRRLIAERPMRDCSSVSGPTEGSVPGGSATFWIRESCRVRFRAVPSSGDSCSSFAAALYQLPSAKSQCMTKCPSVTSGGALCDT